MADKGTTLADAVYENDKLAVFIDGANLHSASKAVDFGIDFKKLISYFRDIGTLVRCHYYTRLVQSDDHVALRPLLDFLEFNSYTVTTKEAHFEEAEEEGTRRRLRSDNLIVDMTIDMLELAPRLDHIVLFSGDGSFTPVVKRLKEKGVRVTVISTLENHMVADQLRRTADNFFDLKNLKALLARPTMAFADRD